jgi:hypothetical protein
MAAVRRLTILTWILLPTVMFGGYSLLRLGVAQELTEFQASAFRAGHAHAGVLLVLALVYLTHLGRTRLSDGLKGAAGGVLLLGVLAQSGGFFLHMVLGAPGESSPGILVTTVGAVLLTVAVGLLVYGLVITRDAPFGPAQAGPGAPSDGTGPTAPV